HTHTHTHTHTHSLTHTHTHTLSHTHTHTHTLSHTHRHTHTRRQYNTIMIFGPRKVFRFNSVRHCDLFRSYITCHIMGVSAAIVAWYICSRLHSHFRCDAREE